MAKISKIDFKGDRLVSLAAGLVDGHNYISALKMLNKNAELSGNDEVSLMLYAEIYDDLGLYEKCINGWFKYMDEAAFTDMTDCYEGLAVSFMNIGNEHYAAFYYNKLLAETDGLDTDMKEEILKEFVSTGDNPLKFSYPPRLEDVSDVIKSGVAHMKAGEYDLAIEEFDKIQEGNPKYLAARNYVAMCNIIADRTEQAEQECLNVLKKYPEDVQALTTLAAVKTETGKTEEALELAGRLLAIDVNEPDEIYKIATVCCENKLHLDAYKLFSRLKDDLEYDLNVLYFRAVSAFNAGNYDDSFNVFDTIVTVFPEAVTARYYYRQAKQMVESGEIVELTYFYRLPYEVRESSLKMLAAYLKLPNSQAKSLAKEVDITDCILWCFDEVEGLGDGELKRLAGEVAVKAQLDGIVRDLLLDAFLDDKYKIDMLSCLAERNTFDCFGVVICNMYKRVTTQPLDLGRNKRKAFVRAYAKLVAHFSILDDEFGNEFAEAAESLYIKLARQNRLDEVKNQDVLTAAIYVLSGVCAAGIEGNGIYSFFEISEEQVKKLTE